jgi:hypothetical protein
MTKRGLLLAAGTVLLYLLHQDFWNWRAARPLAFGFLPVGLTYHALYTLACMAWMAALVKLAWPARLEQDAEDGRG